MAPRRHRLVRDKPLQAKQARFAAEYLKDLNGKQAAIRAGYSPHSAEVTASKLLRHAKVAAAVSAGQAKQLAALEVTSTRVLQETSRIAFGDIRKVFEDTGKLKNIHDLSDDAAAAVSSIDITKERTYRRGSSSVDEAVTKVRMWDKVRALEMLMKHLGLLKDSAGLDLNGQPFTFTLNLGPLGKGQQA